MQENRALFPTLTLLLLMFAFLGCGTPPAPEPVPTPQAPEEPEAPQGDPFAVIATSEGEITVRLRPDLAPETVENFIQLANKGFYYNTLFHRVIPDTLIQGGDPNSKDNNPYNDGQGNSGRFLPAEFSKEPFDRGTVAMARQPQNRQSGSCQFFICLRRIDEWDGEYTVFGEVVEGIEVAEKISNTPRSKESRLTERPTGKMAIKRVRIEYR